MISNETLNQIKEKLESEKTRLEEELLRLGAKKGSDKPAWEEYGSSEEENAAEVTAYTDSLGLTYELEAELKEVSGALERIAHGRYGVCASCGEEIAEARLTARPMSIYCVACQSKVEHS
ncbi:TraR/DksA family transcriptional regulator [Candidatus Uhrbacteria bacterium]|nr:TraR/DksA family transcriptional regulator [Candidatus Uhrbacteria bacterium]